MSRWLVGLMATVISVGLLEAALRVSHLDLLVLRSGLFFQQADLPVHQCSADPFLHYELKPDSSWVCDPPDRTAYSVHIDRFASRYPTHPLQKGQGTVRVLGFGGSTMYGAGVDDEQTITAGIERHLNRSAAGTEEGSHAYEVWNFGTSAYTLGQASHLARSKMVELQADLILVQLHNLGRRTFLPPTICPIDMQTLLDAEGNFFREQFASPRWLDPSTHLRLLSDVALYRVFAARLIPRQSDGTPCEFCEAISRSEARALVELGRERGVEVVFFAIPADRGMTHPVNVAENVDDRHFIDLYRKGRGDVFYEVHPPASTLDEFARLLAEELRDRGFLAGGKGAPE